MNHAQEFAKQINRYIVERERVNLQAIYDALKDQYPLILTNTFSLPEGKKDYGEDFEVLLGKSPAGQFFLYDDRLYIVFDVDKADGSYTHWHPADTAEAMEDVRLFMQGICRD